MSQINHLEMFARCSFVSGDSTEYLWFEIVVDGVSLVNFGYFAVDLGELIRSIQNEGEFLVLTCWCGAPECVAIEEGIKVTHDVKLIRWSIKQPKQFNFTFEKSQYEAEIRKIIKQGKQLLAEAKYAKRKTPEIVPDENATHLKFN